ncbi:FMRFamide-activated amiloride-sensitive sodium channel [Caerostris darwini]|uniref:FMRFamide-activated amiloride-sensitive sodium channel n=1 Tax=Caerostris darwini TaxID=1538125 RepID=A0AAV4P5Q2_9ARAC|nr:FMRFamide-activated amiloride-sensitive sodium channel [Caerostris darwini]
MTSCKTKEDGSNKPSEGEKVSLPIKSLEEDQENFKTIVFNLLTNSSVYAVAQLVSSSGCGRKLLWFVVLVVGVLGCSYEVYRFLSLYFQYPVVITLEVQNTWKLNFPAVTVCNLNRIPLYYYECLRNNRTVEDCTSFCQRKKPPQYGPIRPVLTSERQRYASCSNNFDGVFSEQRTETLEFLNLYLHLSKEERHQLGHQADSFIRTCSFNGESCSIGNFSNFLSIEFGNCFTFNGKYGIDAEPLQTSYIGPNSGLELTLNLEVPDYSPITPSVGARVVINKADSQPNPEDHGINISPGFETSVALKQTSIHRLPHPYRDKCRSYEEQSLDYSKDQEVVADELSDLDCIRNCMQKVNLHRCGCVDPFLPVTNSSKLCDLKNQTSICCLDDAMKSLSKDDTPCPCPLPCK